MRRRRSADTKAANYKKSDQRCCRVRDLKLHLYKKKTFEKLHVLRYSLRGTHTRTVCSSRTRHRNNYNPTNFKNTRTKELDAKAVTNLVVFRLQEKYHGSPAPLIALNLALLNECDGH